jgi:hypothetical protein
MIFYYLIIALQLFCFYHAYNNRSEIYWYAIIFFLPLIGCLIYVFLKILNPNNVKIIGEEVSTAISPSKQIIDLTEKVEFSDTYTNRVALADAYFKKEDFQKALDNYQIVLNGTHKNDVYAQEQLIMTNYYLGNHDEVVSMATSLTANSDFRASKILFYMGLSYKNLGKFKAAEKSLRALDIRYSNYEERLVLAQFLIEREKTKEAKELIEELLIEFNYMSGPNKKLHKTTFTEVKKISDSLHLKTI